MIESYCGIFEEDCKELIQKDHCWRDPYKENVWHMKSLFYEDSQTRADA